MARGERGQGLVRQSQANLWTVLGGIAAVLSLAIPLLSISRDQFFATPEPRPTTGPPVSVPTRTHGAAPAPASTPPAPVVVAPTGDVVSQGQVVLRIDEGVNVDVPAPQATAAAGPNGPIDLSYDLLYKLRATGGVLYSDQGAEKDAWTRCQRAVAGQKGGVPYGLIYPQAQYCFRTSNRRVAWLRVNDWSIDGAYVVVNVTVWSTPAP